MVGGPVNTSRLYGPLSCPLLLSISALLMYVYHFDVEEESLAGQRMVQPQYYCVVFDLFYNWSNGFAARIFPIQLRPYLDLFRNVFLRDLVNRGQIFRPVTVLRWHDHMLSVSDLHTLHRILDAADDLVSALRVCEFDRGVSHIGVDDLVVVQLEGVFQRNHFAV